MYPSAVLESVPFTFQPGYIQIEMQWDEFKALLAFTFQPGYIQMYVLTPVKVLENLFTFQPGYIQILTGKLIRLALEIGTLISVIHMILQSIK